MCKRSSIAHSPASVDLAWDFRVVAAEHWHVRARDAQQSAIRHRLGQSSVPEANNTIEITNGSGERKIQSKEG